MSSTSITQHIEITPGVCGGKPRIAGHRSDEEQVIFALTEERVIFTQDDDFLRLHQGGVNHCGITYCRQRSRTIGEIINTLALIWEWLELKDIKGKVEFI